MWVMALLFIAVIYLGISQYSDPLSRKFMEDSKKMSIKDGLKIIEDADIKKVIEEIKKDTKIYELYKSTIKNKGPKEGENHVDED